MELQRHLDDADVPVCAFLLANDFGREDRDREIAWVARVAEVAVTLDVPAAGIGVPAPGALCATRGAHP